MMYTRKQFIDIIGEKARIDMEKSGILASLTIAQAILESCNGNSGLTKQANNLFGMKGSYKGQSVTMETWEQTSTGHNYKVNAIFRKYPNWEESISDHSKLFNSLARYKNLRGERDYKKACLYVRQDGYATDINYTEKLIDLIEENNLQRFDEIKEIIHIGKEVSNIIKNGYSLVFNCWKRSDLINLNNVPSLLARLGGIEYLYKIGVITDMEIWEKGKYSRKNVCSLLIKFSNYLNDLKSK